MQQNRLLSVVEQQNSLAGLPSLLSMLSTFPEPNTALESFAHRQLGKYQVRGAALWHVHHDVALLIAMNGHSPEEAEQWTEVPLNSEAPVAQCIRESQIFTYSPDSYRRTFPSINHVPATDDEVHWFFFGDAMRDTENGVGAVVVPISARGITIGCYGFMTQGEVDWSTPELYALSSYATSLGLWLSNTSRLASTDRKVTPRMTERQLEILRLVLHGHSNSFIAARIGVSLSTVKQEIQRTCVALNAQNRADAAARALGQGLIDA